MKTKNLLIFLFMVNFYFVTAQDYTKTDTNYIPLLVDSNAWYIAEGVEFGEINRQILYSNDTGYYNDTAYRRIGPHQTEIHAELREDTILKKVYIKYGESVPEELFYDFTMEVGDSIKWRYTGWYWVVDIDYTNTLGGKRKTWYFNSEDFQFNPIWIEGIGSLAGVLKPEYTLIMYWWGFGELLCYEYNGKMIYKSENGEEYGCQLEHLGIDEMNKMANTLLQPNPLTDFSYLNFKNPNSNSAKIQVYNSIGRIVFQSETNENYFRLNRTDFYPGIFIYHLTIDKNIISTNKFIVH